MRDHLNRRGDRRRGGWLRGRGAQAGVGLLFERAREIDQQGAACGRELRGATAGGGRGGQERDLDAIQALRVQRDHDHGFVVFRGQDGGAVRGGRDQLHARRRLLCGEHIADLPRQQRSAAHHRHQGTLRRASQFHAPAAWGLPRRLGMERRRPHAPANGSANADRDAAQNITDRQRQQRRLRKVPDQINGSAQNHDSERRSGPHQLDVLEAGITPRADHEKGQQGQHRQPRGRENPPVQRRAPAA